MAGSVYSLPQSLVSFASVHYTQYCAPDFPRSLQHCVASASGNQRRETLNTISTLQLDSCLLAAEAPRSCVLAGAGFHSQHFMADIILRPDLRDGIRDIERLVTVAIALIA